MRLLFCVALLACGRIGFDSRPGSDATAELDGATLDDAGGELGDATTGDGTAASCSYQDCAGSDDACCVGDTTTCVTAGTCTGLVLECNPNMSGGCPQFMQCCPPGTCTASQCT